MKNLKVSNKGRIFKIIICVVACIVLTQNSSHAASIPKKISYTEYIKGIYNLSSENAHELEKQVVDAKEDYASRYTPYIDIDYALGRTTDGTGNYTYYTGNNANIIDTGGNLVISDDINSYMEERGLYVGSRANESNGSYRNAIQYLPIMQKYGEMYGVDPYLALAIACQESSGKHDASTFREDAGCGIMQIEAPGKVIKEVSATNLLTGNKDTMIITYAEMTEPDADKNIKAGIMNLSSKFNTYGDNLYLAIQSYNYGSGGAAKTVKLYIEGEKIATGDTQVEAKFNEIKKDPSVLGWMGYRKLIHEDPGKHLGSKYNTGSQCRISDCPNKGRHVSGSTYGDPFYVERILSYYHQASTTS